MDANERSEVREMIHGVLSGWEAQTRAREELINLSLEGISDHLGRINGSISRHDLIINANLPHTIANCPQNEVIQEIHDAVISGEATETAIQRKEERDRIAKELKDKQHNDRWQKVIWVAMGIIAIVSIWVNIWINNRKFKDTETVIKSEIRDQEGISKVTRGGYIKFNDAGLQDSIKIK